jgi:hypothetical protein
MPRAYIQAGEVLLQFRRNWDRLRNIVGEFEWVYECESRSIK